MHTHAELKRIIDDWLVGQGCKSDWSRSINPPGELLHLSPFGLKLLITDSATEDNSPSAIFEALVRQLGDKLEVAGDWLVKSNLTLVVR